MSDDEMTTQPTIDTLIAHIDRWGAKFSNELSELRQGQEEFRTGQTELRQSVDELRKGQDELRKGQDELRKGQDELRKGQDELRKGQEQLRTDLNAGLRRVERKIEILNDNFLSIKADIRDLEVRMEKLESESLARS
jgi:uncharacterized phage infection (PIP) family protein YhgE